MWKDALIVAGAAGVGQWVAGKYGTKIEAFAVGKKIPPTLAHAAVVGLGTGAVFLVVKAFL